MTAELKNCVYVVPTAATDCTSQVGISLEFQAPTPLQEWVTFNADGFVNIGKSGETLVWESVFVLTSQTSFSKKFEKTVALHVEEVRTLIVIHAPFETVDVAKKEGFQVILVPASIEFDGLLSFVLDNVGDTNKLTEFLSGEIHEEMNQELRLKDQDLKLKNLN